MKLWRWLKRYWKNHGTKALGFLSMVVSGLPPIDGLIAAHHKPYWSAAGVILGALTIQRGMTNTKNTPPIA
jgi:hypothetical protein